MSIPIPPPNAQERIRAARDGATRKIGGAIQSIGTIATDFQMRQVSATLRPDENDNKAFDDIQEFEVGFPAELCQSGVRLLDSPGTDEDPKRTKVTAQAVERCDAAVVLYVSKPFGGIEARAFSDRVVADGGTTFAQRRAALGQDERRLREKASDAGPQLQAIELRRGKLPGIFATYRARCARELRVGFEQLVIDTRAALPAYFDAKPLPSLDGPVAKVRAVFSPKIAAAEAWRAHPEMHGRNELRPKRPEIEAADRNLRNFEAFAAPYARDPELADLDALPAALAGGTRLQRAAKSWTDAPRRPSSRNSGRGRRPCAP